MSRVTDWSGDVAKMLEPITDPIEAFRKSIQTVMGKKLAKGETVGRVEAEILYALAQNKQSGRLDVGDI